MRPPGEIRQAMLAVAWEAAGAERKPATVHDMTRRLVPQGVSRAAVRNTWHNLVRSGVLAPVGTARAPGVSRPLLACVPAPLAPQPQDAGADLARAWASGRTIR